MIKRSNRVGLVILIFTLALTACDAVFGEPVVMIPGVAETFAVQTMAVHTISSILHGDSSTPTPSLPASASPTQNNNQDLATLQPELQDLALQPTRTPIPTLTPGIFNTAYPIDVEPIDPNAPCNAAKFIQDVTIPDATLIKPQEQFKKIWAIRNVGTCTWKKNEYALVKFWGANMGTNGLVPLQFDVVPGQTAELAIDMEAPLMPACWYSNWMLQDGEGNRFGVGPNYKNYFWVAINVWWPGVPDLSGG